MSTTEARLRARAYHSIQSIQVRFIDPMTRTLVAEPTHSAALIETVAVHNSPTWPRTVPGAQYRRRCWAVDLENVEIDI